MDINQLKADEAKAVFNANVPQPVPQVPAEIPAGQSANTASSEELDALAQKLNTQQQPQQQEIPQEVPQADASAEQPTEEQSQQAPPPPPPGVMPHDQPMDQQLKSEDAAFGQDLVAGHIKPETYHDIFAKKDTLGKIGTIFGLILGGAGAGLTHQPNALLAMMDKEIERDFEAQKSNQGNDLNTARFNSERKLNLAHIENLKKSGALTDQQAKNAALEFDIKHNALEMMRKRRVALHSLVQKVNKFPVGSPQRAQAEQALAGLAGVIDKENFDLADQAAAHGALMNVMFGNQTGAPGADPEASFQQQNDMLRRFGNPELAKIRESQHIPGVQGHASRELTAEDREKALAGMQFQNKLARMIEFTKAHPQGTLDPTATREGAVLAAELSSAYRQAIGGGVYKEGEQGFINKVIDEDPTKFLNKVRVLPKLLTVQKESQNDLNDRLKSYGFNGYDGPKQEPMMMKSKSGKNMVQINGKWYYK